MARIVPTSPTAVLLIIKEVAAGTPAEMATLRDSPDNEGVNSNTASSHREHAAEPLSTQPVSFIFILLVLIKSFSPWQGFDFVTSAGLVVPSIQTISVIRRLSYAWRKHRISIIKRFSCVVPNFTRHSYNDLESVHSIRGKLSICSISSIVYLIEAPVSKPWAIPYNSDASTLRVMRLHFVEDQCKMFALSCLSVSTMTYPICDEWSGLFAKEESVNTSSRSESGVRFRGTNRSPLVASSICQSRCVYNYITTLTPFPLSRVALLLPIAPATDPCRNTRNPTNQVAAHRSARANQTPAC